MRSRKKYSYLDRWYKNYCCGAKNHPHGWAKDKKIARRAARRKLKSGIMNNKDED